ncbi:terminase small subunit [Secundilactobacillus kimchicus]|uniref:terminase small subunit n=1 Tax=Secundilactobacillus kimchicus TaxID=528209 RepID=UPI0024A86F53|nr:terminase small subunit [Secundilactobacillus kimchicus]
MKLTVKQQKFADNYIETGNATQAAIDAGYAKRSAHSIGTENLQKPAIKQYVEEKMVEIQSKKIMDATEALELITRIARGEEKETVFVPLLDGSVSEEEKAADLKTKMAAAKEILKRHPADDRMMSLELRRREAEAILAEHKADEVQETGSEQMDTLSELMNKLTDDITREAKQDGIK